MSCLKIKFKKNTILILFLISFRIFYPLIEDKEFLLKNKEDPSEFQKLDLNQVGVDQESFLKWKEQNLKADKNEDGISDALEARLKDSAEVRSFNKESSELEKKSDKRLTEDIIKTQHQTPEQIPLDNIPIIVHFPEGDYNSISLLFEDLGGSIKSTFKVAINGFAGRISQNALNKFSDSLRQNNVPFFIEEDRIYQAQLYYTGRNMNLRPYVWNTLSYDGDEYSSIAILDTGLDDSHNFFSPGYPGKIIGWRDEVNFLSSPYDDNGHGSHTSGIASGIGTPSYDASGRTVVTAAYEFDQTGFLVDSGPYMFNWTRFNVTDPGLIELFCEFNDMTPGPDDVDLWVYLYYGNTMVDSYEIGSNSWSQTLSYTATSSSLGAYSFRLTMNLIDNTGDSYVSDFNIRFRSEIHWPFDPPQMGSGDLWKGVAPDSNLVGVKVLDQYGYGWTSDIVNGINWVITNKMVYNITTMSLSLGSGSGDTAMINAVNTAVENGIVTVVAAGNDGPGGNYVGSPGDADNVITVSLMSINDGITDYSSQGGPSYSGNTIKPDITAPGGSFNNLQMFSTDTNDNDAFGGYPIDGYANDLDGAQGTSMSAPAVSGASNLLIEAMGGHQSWGYTATEAKKVKALLLMSATETFPLLRETYSTLYSPILNRGGKDVHEGYGRLNVDVAIEAYTQELTLGSQFNAWITSSLNDSFNKHGLGSYANLIDDQDYAFALDVPSGADFDLHLYSDNASSIGEPVLITSSTSTGLGTDEIILYTATSTGKYYLIAKAISGEGNATISYPIIDHDLRVSLEVPSSPDVGSKFLVNATVTNMGINVESNVDLLLYLDGVLIDSFTVSTLPVGSNKTINYMWSPTVFTTYNFTAYAPPIPNEWTNANNVVTELVIISTLRNYTMVPGYTYTWIDSSGGTELLLLDDDYAAIPLPFSFPFYNDTFSTVYISSNGWLSFVNPTPFDYSNIQFPTDLPEYWYMIAPFWDDLLPAAGGGSGNIYVQSFGTYWVVEWANIWHYSSGPTVGSFEVVLSNTGEIIFNYDYISYTGGGYTSGLNLGEDIQYYNSYQGLTDLTDDFAVQFTSELVDLDHDLSVSLDVPSSSDVGDTYIINTTVTNTGINNETNVDLFLYLDGGSVNSTTILSLPVGASETINYLWTPSIYKNYNFTAYSPPVGGESYITNNIATRIIAISNLRNYIISPGYNYTWMDASGETELLFGDDDYTAISLPFDFTFYDAMFSTVYVSSNGWLSFVNPLPFQYSNIQFPTDLPEYRYMIAPFWDDLDPSNGGNIYVQSFGTYWVVEWASIWHYSNNLVGSFEIVLYESGEIVFNYDYIDYATEGYTCGLNLGVDTRFYNNYQSLTGSTDDFSIQFTYNVPLPLTITTPDSTSTWETDTSHTITWTSIGTISNVKIELYENDVFVMEIVASTPNDGEFSWTIPSSLIDSTSYQIKITNAVNPATDDVSDYFEIFTSHNTLTVINPDSLTVWETGTSHTITWTSTGSIVIVKIELYENDLFVMEVAVSTPNGGSYDWAIPVDLGNSIDYQIRISDVSNPATYDESNYFAITSIPILPEPPGIPGYNLYLIIATISILSIFLTKRRMKKA